MSEENENSEKWTFEPKENTQTVETAPTVKKDRKMLNYAVIAVVFLVVGFLVSSMTGFTGQFVNTNKISSEQVSEKIMNFLRENPLLEESEITIESIEENNGVFELMLNIDGQGYPSFATLDGKFLFPKAIDLNLEEVIPTETNQPIVQPPQQEERIDVSADDDPVKGDPNAPVTIIEFSDFQCPYCEKFYSQTLPQIIENYVDTGKVKFVFRDFPLDMHQNAQKASEASECADNQGKFWEYHDKLFENQGSLDTESLKQYADELGLDTEKFNNCLDSGKYEDEVQNDIEDGKKYGVTGTPAFFINGIKLSGARPFSDFKIVIDAELGN